MKQQINVPRSVRFYTQHKLELRACSLALWELNVKAPLHFKNLTFFLEEICDVINYYKRFPEMIYGFEMRVKFTEKVVIPVQYMKAALNVLHNRRKYATR